MGSLGKFQTTFMGVVYPWNCDNMGHMITQNYMVMFDDATLHFIHSLGFSFKSMEENRKGWADVKHTIEYKKEVLSGSLITISPALLGVGNKSIQYRHEMRNTETKDLYATLDAVTVYFDLEKRDSILLFDELKKNIQCFL